MAIDYTTTNTGLFYRLGKLIKSINDRAASFAALDAEMLALVNPFEAADATQQASSIYSLIPRLKNELTAARQGIGKVASAIFSDRTTVLDQLSLLNFSGNTFFDALYARMLADAKTVDASVVTVGSTIVGGHNIGNGTVIVTKTLDGYNSATFGAPVMRQYGLAGGKSSEIARTETMNFACVADADNGAQEGAERFTWEGGPGDPPFGQREGSGAGPQLIACGGSQLIPAGAMESFTADLPNGWTAVTGTAGTHILQTTTAGQFYRGSAALKLINSGSLADITLTAPIPPSSVNPLRAYLLTFRIKASASFSSGIFNVDIRSDITSTDYTAIAVSTLPTSWTLYSVVVVMPQQIPSDLLISMYLNGTPDNGKSLYVDDVFLSELVYHGGVAAVIVPGSTRFAVGDVFTVTINNNGAGLFQEFVRKWAGVQLPSDNAGGETILDSLAT